MADSERRRRAPGSRTMLDVLRGWIPWRTRLEAPAATEDNYEVSCFIRGNIGGTTRRWRQGILPLGASPLHWHHWIKRSTVVEIPSGIRIIEVRAVTELYLFGPKRNLFQCLRCETKEGGWCDLAVPTRDVKLVRPAIDHLSHEP